jgi:processive 1,2-diacylglycerol beta-glucosyltransferase
MATPNQFYFEDVEIGKVLETPAMTVTDAHVALYGGLVGVAAGPGGVQDFLPLCLSSGLGWRVPQPPVVVLAFMGFDWKFLQPGARRRHHPQRVQDRGQAASERERRHHRGANDLEPARRNLAIRQADLARGTTAGPVSAAGPRVLILTASYGSGHNRVAATLAAQFRRDGALPRVVDHFYDLVHPEFDRLTRNLYYAVLRRVSVLWGGAYWLGDQLSVSSPLLIGLNRLGTRKLARLLRAEPPDHVVSVHPTPVASLSELRRRGLRIPSHTTVFTDFVAHTQWIHPHVDRYCVPAEEIARDLTARGVARERVTVTGIPVGEEFVQPSERAQARLGLGLSPRLPVLLFMDGSGGGFGRLEEATRTVLAMEEPLQALVVTGREEALEARLRQLAVGRESRIKIFGYVDNVRQLMAAADFLVTKAGGLTLGEALAAELPVICFGSLPGQEARNERFAAMAGVALVASSGAQLQRVIGAALRDPVLLRNIRERIRSYRRPQAAAEIVEMVLTGRGSRGNAPRDRRRVAARRAGGVGDVHVGRASPGAAQRLARAAHRACGRADLRRRAGSPAHAGDPRRARAGAGESRVLPHRGAGGGGARHREANRRRGA